MCLILNIHIFSHTGGASTPDKYLIEYISRQDKSVTFKESKLWFRSVGI